MAGSGPPVAGRTGSARALAPPWAGSVAVIALMAEIVLAGLVWHATRLDPVDAWVMRWQERIHSHDGGVAGFVGTLTVGAMLFTIGASAALAWLAGRRDAVVLALTAAPAALVTEVLLKELVHRTWNGDPALLFPSGHVAVATAAAMTAVLVLRVVPAPPRACTVAAGLGGGFVVVVAAGRLVETVHSLTDVVGGATMGLVVCLGAAMAITAWSRRDHLRASSGSSRWAPHPFSAPGQSRS
jgi:membrane-associated phospholipid phosphatase